MASYCGTNTLAIGRPSQSAMASSNCSSACSDLGPVDPLEKSQLGPRPNREKVRQQIRDYVLFMLGAPTLKIELDEQAIDFCIDQSLKIVEDYAPSEYFSYYNFNTNPGQSTHNQARQGSLRFPPYIQATREALETFQIYKTIMYNFPIIWLNVF